MEHMLRDTLVYSVNYDGTQQRLLSKGTDLTLESFRHFVDFRVCYKTISHYAGGLKNTTESVVKSNKIMPTKAQKSKSFRY